MNKKAILLPVLMLGLSACGEAPAASPSSVNPDNSSASAPAGDTVEISFWHTFGQKNGEALKKTAADFEALVKKNLNINLKITLSYSGGYDDIYKLVDDAMKIGSQPTMAIAYADHVAKYISNEGSEDGKFVVDLDPLMEDEEIGFGTQRWLGDFDSAGEPFGEDDIVDSYLDEGRHFVKEGTYTYPFMRSTEALFYNLDAVERAFQGWKPEVISRDAIKAYMNTISWDEFMDLCEYINDHKATVLNTIKSPLYYDSDGNFFISKMYQNKIGYSSIDPATKMGVVDFESGDNRTKAEAMVKTLKQQFDRGTFLTKGTNGTYGSDSFKKGESVFTVGSTGGTGYNMPDGDSFKVAVCPVPASNNNPLYVSQGPSITFLKTPKLGEEENNRRIRMAWMFAKYLTNPAVNVYQCTYGSEGYTPIRYSAYETPEYQSFIEDDEDIFAMTGKLLIDVISNRYFNTAVFPGSADLREQAGGILSKVLARDDLTEETIDAFITQAFAEGINTAKGKFR